MPVVRTGCSHWLDKTVVQVSSLMDNGCSELVDEIKPRWLSNRKRVPVGCSEMHPRYIGKPFHLTVRPSWISLLN